MDLHRQLLEAENRVRDHVRVTSVELSASLSAASGAQVFLKLENYQVTGSFKVRGALNKLASLSPAVRARGVVAASAGNHGAAVAWAAGLLGSSAVVYMARSADAFRRGQVESLGAEVRVHGDDCVEAEREARSFAEAHGMTYVSPYNDPEVIAGQGTLGLELHRQVGALDAVFVALGGGGLMAGVAGALRAVGRTSRMVACSPANSPVLHASLQAGRIVDLPALPTLSDATAGGIEEGAITLARCRELVDESLLVTEEEIVASLRWMLQHQRLLLEGAAALPVAGFQQTRERWRGRSVALILCGANLNPQKLKALL